MWAEMSEQNKVGFTSFWRIWCYSLNTVISRYISFLHKLAALWMDSEPNVELWIVEWYGDFAQKLYIGGSMKFAKQGDWLSVRWEV